MGQLIWKNKVVALWFILILNFIAALIMPDSIALINEEVGAALSPLIAFYFLLTCLMIWLTLVMKPSMSRWSIMSIGVFYAVIKVQWLVSAVTGEIIIQLFITESWGLIVALMLVWYGWHIPKQVDNE